MQKNQNKLWWVDEIEARIFNSYIQRHILFLSVSYLIEGVPKVCWFSGFLIYTNKLLIWMTAGHVLHKLDELLYCKKVSGIKARWIDDYEDKKASFVPCDLSGLHRAQIDVEGYDLGIVTLRPFYAAPILKNGNKKPLTESYWIVNDGFKAEGYYLVGAPEEFTISKQINKDSKKVDFKSSATCIAIPLIKEDQALHQSEGDFWQYENNFYGKICPILNDDGSLLTDISGMSGGPIFGVQKINEKKYDYRLIALQSSWLPQSKFMRGTLFAKIIGPLESAISSKQSQITNSDSQ